MTGRPPVIEHGTQGRSPSRSLALFGTIAVLSAVLFVQACTNREVVGVTLSDVSVAPETATIQEGESLRFSAILRDIQGNVLPPGANVVWTSDDPQILSVDSTGMVQALVRGTATVRATFGGMSGVATVTVTAAADISVSAASGPTTEVGGQATFTVVLTGLPTSNVTIGLTSSDTTEATIAIDSVTFTPTDWNVAQTVTVTGQDDPIDDGDVAYSIITAPAVSTDLKYSGVDAADASFTNIDDETAGFTVSPPSGPTTEAGGSATFTVVLNSQPLADVAFGLMSSDTTEGTIPIDSLVFTSLDWDVAQTVTVTGQDDALPDGNVVYSIVTGPATSGDVKYNSLNAADVAVTNIDNEAAGITASPPSGPTSEAGGQATFTVVLNAEPSADVTIGLSSSDVSEGTVSPASLTFTPVNWNAPQTVTVTGVDDAIADGNVVYSIVTAPATSTDPTFSAFDAEDVSITNIDNETAGITVSPPSGPTSESGSQATFTVVLNSQPSANVTIGQSSGNTNEGTVSPASLTFTPVNWNAPQTVTVTGVDDAIADGNVVYSIVAAPASSSDPNYSGLQAADVVLTNTDNETAGITVSSPSGPTTEAGGQATFTVVLNSQPSADVTIGLSSSDVTEGTVSPASLTFTPANWNAPQPVTVTGVDDAIADGNVVYSIGTAPATSTDPGYSGLNAADVSITNTDNEAAGITISPPSGPTTEAGGQAVFTVMLNSQPSANVTIGLTSSDLTEGTVSPASLTFTTGNWNAAQAVTVTGVDDAIADGNVVYSIVTAAATSTDPSYNGLNAADVSITNTDNETAGITVTPPSGPTTEAGGQATFTVVLNSQPSADVTIGLTSNDLTEGTVSPASLTFTTVNWNAAQTVTVTGVDDAIADGSVVYSIVTAAATSADPAYSGLNAADASVTNTDNETAGITVSPPSGPTTEAGGQATFTVVLNSQPTANVTIGLTSSDLTEGTVSPASLTFTTANWNAAQTVTVTGVDDAIADGNVVYSIVTAAATSGDPGYNGLNPADVSLTNTDNEAAGVVVSPPSGPTTEAGGQATFTVVLNSQPSANVTIGLTSSDLTEGTVSPASLTFTSVNWNAAQTVTVTGVDDAIADGNVVYSIVTAAATSGDPGYSGLNAADVSITNTDNETAGITVSPPSGPTTEAGGQATFTVVLNSQPTANVTIGLSSSDLTEGTVSPASLTFTTVNWNAAQTVTVTGVDDAIADGNVVYSIVTASATSGDPGYNGLNPADMSLTNTDNEAAGVVVSAPSGPTTEAGGQATFTVVLNSQPSANVTIGLMSNDLSEGAVSPASLTFTSVNWNAAQTVTVTGVDDAIADGDVVYSIVTAAATSSDLGYSGLNAPDVSITNTDNETAGITVSPPSGPTTETGGQATFTVSLNSQPTANVTIGLTSSDLTEGTVSPASLTFTSVNWNAGQTVTVSGIDDAIADGNVVYSIVTAAATSGDPGYDGLNAPDVSITNTDNETAGITVSAPSGPTTEAGGQATFTVVLNSQPTASVTVGLSSSDVTEGTVSPASLTFTGVNWNAAQTVTVTGADDAIADGNVVYSIVTAAATSADGSYSGLNAADVSITNTDNETAGITVSPPSGPTTEAGGQATFTVVLNSQPTANVTIGLSSSDLTEGTVSPASLTFTTVNWNAAQTVTVTGVDDLVADGNVLYSIVTAAATSGDPGYTGLNAPDVSITNNDNEAAGVTISPPSGPTTEAGGPATFTVSLTSQPSANVTIGLTSSDLTEGTVSPTSLTFTSANWNTAQTVTVTGVDDAIADGNVVYSIVTADATSSDPNYNGLNVPDVSITNVDDETSGITVSAPSGPTTEAGGPATFTVVLNSQPSASVTIGLTSSDSSEGTVSPTSLTFTTANWNAAQTVTVTGQNDPVDDGNVVYSIVTAAATSTDPNYSGLDAADVSMTNVDDDTAGVTVSPASGPTTEGGVQATFTVVLNSEPTASVTIGLTSSDSSEGMVSPTSLTFTTTNWNTARTVTVTGVDDAIDDDIVIYSIVTAPATSADPNYTNLNPADVSITSIDDGDTAGVTVNPTGGLVTTEAGGTATFTVVLTSEPTSNVSIGIASNNTGEGAVSASSLTFTAGNWNTAQQVTVTGQNEFVDDGDIAYTIITTSTSADPIYNGINPTDVSVTNIDDDEAMLSINDVAVTEGNTGSVNASFTVTMSVPSTQTVTVNYATANGTAVAPGDYTAIGTTQLTFTPGTTTQPVNVAVIGDLIDELDETFDVNLSGPVNATIVGATGVGTINDDDEAMLSINDVAVTEGTGGTATAAFTVSLSLVSDRTVTVNYATSNGTAVAPGDYTAIGTTLLTFAPGVTTQPVDVTVISDALDEVNETFNVTLSGGVNATIADATGVGTINDDDPLPTLSIADAAPVLEGNAGPTNATFNVTLSPVSGRTVTVNYTTVAGTATAGADYVTTTGTLTFLAGVTTQQILVPVNGDTLDENDPENFTVTLSGQTNATIADGSGLGTITDDDPLPTLSIADAAPVLEGNAGPTNATFNVTLSPVSGRTVTVNYTTVAGTATAGADYVTTTGTLTFLAGVTTQQILVPVNGDTLDENDETFTVTLSGETNATIVDGSGLGTITDDDALPALSIGDAAPVLEGNSGPTNAAFNVTLSPVSGRTVTVNYTTVAGAATAGADYVTTTGTLTFLAGVTTQQILVPVNGDTLDENDETFTVTLSGETNATIVDGSGLGTITDDDALPALSIGDAAPVLEGNSGPTNAAFNVTLSPVSGRTVTVNYTTVAGAATAGADYVTTTGTLTFNAGITTQQILVPVNGDTLDENDETFTVTLSGQTNATIADGSGLGTITDDDPLPTLTIADAAPVLEGNAGPTNATFNVTLSPVSGRTVTVNYTTVAGTATAGADYVTTTGTLTFLAGVTTQQILVSVNGDTLDENDSENFTVTLAGETNATMVDGSGLGTITDDDPLPSLSINNVGVTEGNSGTAIATFTVTLSPASGRTVTVDYATTNGTATAPGDYTAITTTQLTFNAGMTTQQVNVTVNGDQIDEGASETFTVGLTNPGNASIGTATGTGTINDDDTAGITVVPTSGLTTTEVPASTTQFTVVLTSQPTANVTIGVSSNDTTEGVVTTPVSGVLTFTSVNWATPQTVIVSSVDDPAPEPGGTLYMILTAPAASTDLNYSGLNADDVSITNTDT